VGSAFPGAPFTVKFCTKAESTRNMRWRAKVSPAHSRLPGKVTIKPAFGESSHMSVKLRDEPALWGHSPS
jgi:hypothetical protein